MYRQTLVALALTLLASSTVSAQDWAKKMFASTNHDFGNVPRGAKAQYAFEFENLYKEDIHIASVRSSCGCTTPVISQASLKTFEKSSIVATFNTSSFLGSKSATITVVVDKPYYAEVQLHVNGFIRSDIVLNPGGIDFGSLDAGSPTSKKMTIEYNGSSPWQITAIKSPNQHLTAEAVELQRTPSKVTYEMMVNLGEDVAAGYFKESLTIVTNDKHNPQFPVEVEARVIPDLSVSPASLFLGVLKPGQQVTKQVVVRAKKPFRVLAIECGDQAFVFPTLPEESKPLHIIPVTFTAGEKSGKVSGTISIKTDLAGETSAQLVGYAQVNVEE